MVEVVASEVLLRFIAALGMFAACVFIFRGLFIRKALRPRVVWLHVLIVTSLTFLWRLLVLLVASPDLFPDEFIPTFLAWVQPFNQVVYALNAVSLILLAVVSQRRRNGDG
jgi:predicted neutral ceramidase superfamily lipid hydrolase